MSIPRKKISKKLRRTAQRASRHIGYRIPSGACELAAEVYRVSHKTESDPTATQPAPQPPTPEPIRATKQHQVAGSTRHQRIAARRKRQLILSGLSTILLALLAGMILAAFIRSLYLIFFS